MQNLDKLSRTDLHRRLEELQARLGDHPEQDDIQRLLEDLQVHQIELELQNRELLDTRQALEQARDWYADLYDFAPVGYLTLDRKGRILEINLTGAHRLGLERSRLLEMPLTAFVATGESPRLFEHLRETFQQRGKRTAELTIRPRNGPQMDSHLESVALTSADGTVVCRTALMDITDLKQARQAAAEHEAQYRAAIETSSDGFLAIDEQGHIRTVNDAFVRRSGYSRDELLTMRVEDFEAVESAQDVRVHIQEVRRDGNALFETRHRTRSGETWPVEVNAAYWPAAGGRIFAFIRDITERKDLQAQIVKVSTAEQERIGREIHDGIGQQLTALGMLATSLQRRLEQGKLTPFRSARRGCRMRFPCWWNVPSSPPAPPAVSTGPARSGPSMKPLPCTCTALFRKRSTTPPSMPGRNISTSR
ncbi:MAG: PAS domain S-box protein [Gammaproteobacteria bacterium]